MAGDLLWREDVALILVPQDLWEKQGSASLFHLYIVNWKTNPPCVAERKRKIWMYNHVRAYMIAWLSVGVCLCLILSTDSLFDTCLRDSKELQLPQELSRITLIAVKCADTLHPLKKHSCYPIKWVWQQLACFFPLSLVTGCYEQLLRPTKGASIRA